MALLTSSGRCTAVSRLVKLTVCICGATTRLAMKATPSTVLAMATVQPTSEKRAARRPVASKKIGFLVIGPHYIRMCGGFADA